MAIALGLLFSLYPYVAFACTCASVECSCGATAGKQAAEDPEAAILRAQMHDLQVLALKAATCVAAVGVAAAVWRKNQPSSRWEQS